MSRGIYAGLNAGLGSDDDPGHVRTNRARIADTLGTTADRLVSLHQVHSPDAIVVDAPFGERRPKADAMVTATPGIALGVLTADCAPVLFADPEARVIGAAHAGWKGALAGVLASTVDAMIGLGASRRTIRAVLGPAISQENYEVGGEFVDRFLAVDPSFDRFFTNAERPGHARFDLPAFVLDRLAEAGIAAQSCTRCTYGEADRFYSYRRSTHRGESDYGRQISAIMLKGT